LSEGIPGENQVTVEGGAASRGGAGLVKVVNTGRGRKKDCHFLSRTAKTWGRQGNGGGEVASSMGLLHAKRTGRGQAQRGKGKESRRVQREGLSLAGGRGKSETSEKEDLTVGGEGELDPKTNNPSELKRRTGGKGNRSRRR